jgi:hypothetical protein
VRPSPNGSTLAAALARETHDTRRPPTGGARGSETTDSLDLGHVLRCVRRLLGGDELRLGLDHGRLH